MTLRKFRIRNVYASGSTIITEAELDVPTPEELEAEGTDWEDFVQEDLFAITGTGQPEGDACYFLESIDGLEPKITEEWC